MTLPWPPSVLSPNSHEHWRTKSPVAKKYRADCCLLTRHARIKADWDGLIHVSIAFCPPDRRHRDDDNLVAAFKAGRDGMADAMGVDDKRFRIHPYLSPEIVKGGEVRIVITRGDL